MLRPKKSLGQHFLHDRNILRKIVDALEPHPRDTVLEIGPGTGALTGILAGRCSLTAVELDQRAVSTLQVNFGESVRVLHGDVRDLDLGTLFDGVIARVVGNIPYNITSDILFWTFAQRAFIRDALFMMQDEVADRLVARPRTKAYGILSVCTQWYATPRKLFKVSPRSFRPIPDVQSAVVRIELTEERKTADDRAFRRLVRGLFGKRRKTIRNGLRFMNVENDVIAGLGPVVGRRPEELTPDELYALAGHLESVLIDQPEKPA